MKREEFRAAPGAALEDDIFERSAH